MITNFEKGRTAARLGFGTSLCMLKGKDKEEWMQGFKSYKPQKENPFDSDAVGEAFARKHFNGMYE